MTFDPAAYRQESLATWNLMARGWEERHEWMMRLTAPINDWLVDRVEPRPGEVVLDVAGGTGHLAHRVAERVAPDGLAIATDFSPEMVEAARRAGDGRAVANVDYRVLDAERMDLPDDSADVVLCRWGYMLMADPGAALAETRRVLRDGGRLVFAVWTSPDRNPWAAVPGMTLVQRGHMPPPDPTAPGIFGMADPERIRALMAGAGFDEPELERIEFEFEYGDADDVWDSLVSLAGPLARAIRALPEAERDATRAAIEDALAPFRRPDGSYAAPAETWGVSA